MHRCCTHIPVVMPVCSSLCFQAEIWVWSPLKLFIFIDFKKCFLDQSIQKSVLFAFVNRSAGVLDSQVVLGVANVHEDAVLL